MVDREKLEDYFYKGVFLVIMVLVFISVLQLYFSVSQLIGIWFNYRYQPVFQALFSLAVIVVSIYVLREHLLKQGE